MTIGGVWQLTVQTWTCLPAISSFPGSLFGMIMVFNLFLLFVTNVFTDTGNSEFANNIYRDGSSAMNNTEDTFIKDGGVSVDQRKMNAVRAYFEWSKCP